MGTCINPIWQMGTLWHVAVWLAQVTWWEGQSQDVEEDMFDSSLRLLAVASYCFLDALPLLSMRSFS